jgi:hypothetical protein
VIIELRAKLSSDLLDNPLIEVRRLLSLTVSASA